LIQFTQEDLVSLVEEVDKRLDENLALLGITFDHPDRTAIVSAIAATTAAALIVKLSQDDEAP
jgi:hypothetical protein